MDMKEQIIMDYIASINWEGQWSHKSIEEELANLLGERPTIDVEYISDIALNETTGESFKTSRINSITVYYYDLSNKIKTNKILI